MSEHLLISLASVIILGIGAHWLAWRLRLPSILVLLVTGFVAGSVFNLLNPDELLGDLLFPLVSLSVAIILYEGGLTLRFRELPQIRSAVFSLISVGVAVTWLISALTAHYLLDLSWSLSILLGAILVVTGPTVIGPLLQQIRPKGDVGPTLKWEGILIDPVGAVLAVLVFEAIIANEFQQAPLLIVQGVLITILIGLIGSMLGAGLMIVLFSRYWVPDYLHNSVSLVIVIGAFALSNVLQPEAGLLTVTVMGLILANQKFAPVKHIVEFKENLRVLLIASLFILLSARVELSDLTQLGPTAAVFLAVLVFVARPLAVFLSTWRSKLNLKERLFITWMAPRGIVAASVASLFAFELAEAGYPEAERLVPLTFIVIVGTVLLYGFTAQPLARRLGLAEENPQGVLIVGAHPLGRAIAQVLQAQGLKATLLDNNWRNLSQARMEGLETHYGSAASEQTLEEINLDGIGRLLALTSNDEANSLAALHFAEVFGRSEVYQLPILSDDDKRERHTPSQHLRGRVLFDQKATQPYLAKRYNTGAEIKATELTDSFDYNDFKAFHNGTIIPLFLVTKNKQLKIFTTDTQLKPEPGQTLISLIGPQALADAGS